MFIKNKIQKDNCVESYRRSRQTIRRPQATNAAGGSTSRGGGGQRSPLLHEAKALHALEKKEKEKQKTNRKASTGDGLKKKLLSYWTARWMRGVPDWIKEQVKEMKNKKTKKTNQKHPDQGFFFNYRMSELKMFKAFFNINTGNTV